jgi:hypothetical protein
VLDEQSYAEAEVQDLFRKRFQKAWESLMDPYRVRSRLLSLSLSLSRHSIPLCLEACLSNLVADIPLTVGNHHI